MSAPEAKNPPSAGISSPDDLDVAALFEQLRAELRRGVPDADARGAEFAAARALAERFWPVTAEREAGGGVAPAPTVAAQPGAAAVPDYFAYESRMRGSTEAVRERQRI